MTVGINISLDDKAVRKALKRAPSIMIKHLSRGVDRAGLEVANEEKRQAPVAFATLRNSIFPERPDPLTAIIGPHVNYARPVEEGTQGGAVPPYASLLDWVRRQRITPNDPDMSQESLAVVIAKSIAIRGTPPNPFRQRTIDVMRPRVIDLLRSSAAAGLREVRST